MKSIEAAPRLISERDFMHQVRDLAKLFGWRYHHSWTQIHSPAGYPDITLVKGSRLIFCELKSEKGTVHPKQQEWLDALGETGVEVYLFRPSDFERITEILRRD
jgi:hypothetical protein